MSEHASLFALERHRLGETEGDVRAHIESCDHCRDRLLRMESDDRAFMIARPNLRSIGKRSAQRAERAETGARASPERDPRIGVRSKIRIAPLLALAACVLAAILVLPDPDTTRMKGDSHVELIVRRGAETFPFDERPLREGDTLLFKYTSARRHMLLAGVEDSGEVSIFVSDAELEPGQNRIAPQGIELDDHRGKERVIVLLSDAPLDAGEVQETLAAQRDPLKTPHFDYDVDQVTWLIEREQP